MKALTFLYLVESLHLGPIQSTAHRKSNDKFAIGNATSTQSHASESKLINTWRTHTLQDLFLSFLASMTYSTNELAQKKTLPQK